MCGIAGAVFTDDVPVDVDPAAVVRAMTEALAHRGPDGEGVVDCSTRANGHGPTAVLGHRRLAIIDLSDRAAQPMVSESGPVALTYNGEIYNFRELRRELESRGRRLRSESDTEVILRGYEEWGEEVVPRLRGMFAFAIWDGRSRRLLAARDRLGIKPLYVHRTAGRLLFASEIRALLASGLVPRRLAVSTLDDYLAYQTVPWPRTLVDGVAMLPPGTLAVLDRHGSYGERAYWDLLESADRESIDRAKADDARARVADLLVTAAAEHLVSDVPVGVFLSGGIDSSGLASLVRHAGRTPRTFTVTFPGTAFDESRRARAVAWSLGAEHTEIALTEQDVLQQLPAALAAVDHPSGDGINTFVVSRAVRAAGLKVALSGLGGDELFGGYPSFGRLERLTAASAAWRRSPAMARRAAAAAVRAIGGPSIAATKAAALLETDGSVPQAFPILRQMFPADERRHLLATPRLADPSADAYVQLLERAVATHPALETMGLVSYAEARTYMHDVLLRDTDQMSMANGLEVRVPLLDHRLVEYVMALPDVLKRPHGRPKRLLVDSLGGMLPLDVASRPKQGFVLPLELWMRGELRPFCEHHLGPDALLQSGVFRRQAVSELWRSFVEQDGRTTWSRPWTLITLSTWMEQNRITV